MSKARKRKAYKVRVSDQDGMQQTVMAVGTQQEELEFPLTMTCDSVETTSTQRPEWNRWVARFQGHGQVIQFNGRGKCPLRPKQQIVVKRKES